MTWTSALAALAISVVTAAPPVNASAAMPDREAAPTLLAHHSTAHSIGMPRKPPRDDRKDRHGR